MKARLIGPALMIVLGAVLLAAPGGASSMDIGEVNPCTTTTTSTTFPIVKAAAGKAQEAPCGCYDRAAIVDPCATTTTGTPGTPVSFPTTTTTEAPTTTVQTTTTAAETTTTEGTTDTTVIEPTTMVEPTTTMAARMHPLRRLTRRCTEAGRAGCGPEWPRTGPSPIWPPPHAGATAAGYHPAYGS